jgi:hypothetical protein
MSAAVVWAAARALAVRAADQARLQAHLAQAD